MGDIHAANLISALHEEAARRLPSPPCSSSRSSTSSSSSAEAVSGANAEEREGREGQGGVAVTVFAVGGEACRAAGATLIGEARMREG